MALGNEINGIIISNDASANTIGGTASGQGKHNCLQRGGRRQRAVGNGRLDPLEQHLLERAPGH